MKEKVQEKLQEGTKNNFLENLKQAVESGDPAKGAESIKKINEIHKLASTMDGNNAKATFEKRVEEAGEVEAIDQEEAKVHNLRAKEEMLRMQEEDGKLRFIANIENAETELKELNKEFKEVSKQYLEIIEKQEGLVEEMKNKFDEKYKEDGKEEKGEE